MYFSSFPSSCSAFCSLPRCGTADAKIMIPSVKKAELSNALSFKPEIDQKTALPASPTVINSTF